MLLPGVVKLIGKSTVIHLSNVNLSVEPAVLPRKANPLSVPVPMKTQSVKYVFSYKLTLIFPSNRLSEIAYWLLTDKKKPLGEPESLV